jgi:hypothetical protein
MCLSIQILYFMLPCYVFVHPDFVFYVSLLCVCPFRCCILYFTAVCLSMDKHITVKHKIQNVDGQTLCFSVMCLSIQILYFMCHCYVFVHPDVVYFISLLCVCPSIFCISLVHINNSMWESPLY